MDHLPPAPYRLRAPGAAAEPCRRSDRRERHERQLDAPRDQHHQHLLSSFEHRPETRRHEISFVVNPVISRHGRVDPGPSGRHDRRHGMEARAARRDGRSDGCAVSGASAGLSQRDLSSPGHHLRLHLADRGRRAHAVGEGAADARAEAGRHARVPRDGLGARRGRSCASCASPSRSSGCGSTASSTATR